MARKLTLEEDQIRVQGLWRLEHECFERGYHCVAGVDEAGRGPLAGPVYAAAVILPEDFYLPGINDSKKISEKKREELYELIIREAKAYSICAVDEKIIDDINILNATYQAMNGAVNTLPVEPDYVLVDGNRIQGMTVPHETVVKGDAKSISIAAASVLAKVSRDHYMLEMNQEYPQYGFAAHKGYGTKVHNEAILTYGPCPIHRRTFLKKLLGEVQ